MKQRVHTHYLSSSFAYLLIGLRDGSWMVYRRVALFDRIRGWPYCLSGGHGLVNFTASFSSETIFLLWEAIDPLFHGLSARRCLMSPHFLARWVSRLLWLTLVSWTFTCIGDWCPSLFPLPSISQCFSIHSSSPAIGFHSSNSHSDGICTPPPTLLLYPCLGTGTEPQWTLWRRS